MSRTLTLDYDGEAVTYHVDGETAWGGDHVLLLQDDDLTAGCDWATSGFTVASFLDHERYDTLASGVRDLLAGAVGRAGITVPADFSLEKYHLTVDSDEAHRRVFELTPGCFPIEQFPIPAALVDDRVSAVVGVPVSTAPPHAEFPPHFCIRVVRPRSRDNNPPHRDVWLDRLRHAVNIYVPLAGSSGRSSLPLVEGSHRWRESEIERTVAGARIDDRVFTVPSVVGAAHPLAMKRPSPGPNELLVFSPYLIHGGAFNQQTDLTRVSLEMRFWRRQPAEAR